MTYVPIFVQTNCLMPSPTNTLYIHDAGIHQYENSFDASF